MRDVHVHFLHGNGGTYSIDFFEGFISAAQRAGLDEIFLLEHTHQFIEFESVYAPVKAYNHFQRDWLARKMNGSIESYLQFINSVKGRDYPVKVKFGLEVCYLPETANELSKCLKQYRFDFLTGSVHWIDGWGFDHPGQKEIWDQVDVNDTYRRYYAIMCQLCESGLFRGLAHPDSIRCFGHTPSIGLADVYHTLGQALNRHHMYAENSGGLRLNYNQNITLGLNQKLMQILKDNNVPLMPASDAHRQSDVGANIQELQKMIDG